MGIRVMFSVVLAICLALVIIQLNVYNNSGSSHTPSSASATSASAFSDSMTDSLSSIDLSKKRRFHLFEGLSLSSKRNSILDTHLKPSPSPSKKSPMLLKKLNLNIVPPDPSRSIEHARRMLRSPVWYKESQVSLKLKKFLGRGHFRTAFSLDLCVNAFCDTFRDPGTNDPLMVKIAPPRTKGFDEPPAKSHARKEDKLLTKVVRVAKGADRPLIGLDVHVATFEMPVSDLLDNAAPSLIGDDLHAQLTRAYSEDKKAAAAISIHRMAGSTPSSFSDYASLRSFWKTIIYGLGTIHLAGYAHTDLKKANLKIRGDGGGVLVDFGDETNFEKVQKEGGMSSRKLPARDRLAPPERNLGIGHKMLTAGEFDMYQVGVLFLDHLFAPCIILGEMGSIKGNNDYAHQELARRLYDTFGQRMNHGTDVRNIFSDEFLESIEISREESVREREKNWYAKNAVERWLSTPGRYAKAPYEGGCKPHSALEKNGPNFLAAIDVGMRMIAPDAEDRPSADQALAHEFFTM